MGTLLSFVFFTGLVALITYVVTRREDTASQDGFFLAGRSLTFPFIAGSLLLTNLSTEQMVGLNGSAFFEGLSVMVWEVEAVVALVLMAIFFLPRFLKSGVTTVPEFLEERYDKPTQVITNLVFLLAYATILLPIVLYTGARGLADILNMRELTGIQSDTSVIWLAVWIIGIGGSIYALWGGLRTVAVSDVLNGFLLLTGGLAITYFGLNALSGGQGLFAGVDALKGANAAWIDQGGFDRLNSIGARDQEAPFMTLFTGVLIINCFYWCTNQQIIQRTLGAKSLAEGQKGVLLCGTLKLIGPLYLVLPGIMAFFLWKQGYFDADLAARGETTLRNAQAYGTLVRHVLPNWLTGFFAAALIGAVLSSFNSALNSTCTLFSLGVYKGLLKPNAPDKAVVASGRWFGVAIAVFSMSLAPILNGQDSIFKYLQQMNGIYFIPIFAVVLVGMLSKRVPPLAAKAALVLGVLFIVFSYYVAPLFMPEGLPLYGRMNVNHFLAIVFAGLVLLMLVIGWLKPMAVPWVHRDSGRVHDMRPWWFTKYAGALLLLLVVAIYARFADMSVLNEKLHTGVETLIPQTAPTASPSIPEPLP